MYGFQDEASTDCVVEQNVEHSAALGRKKKQISECVNELDNTLLFIQASESCTSTQRKRM